jgi:flagellar hook protein FlgE
MDPIAIASYGLFAASRRLEASAGRVAGMSMNSDVDLGREMVEQISAKHQFKASINVIKTADEMLGELLDMKA